ncbi:hypothetical protein SAMN04488134_101765 [Amphibacillus marinus]|uniref:Uncharacterized protein n=1 Tax=Amphibacillus marinus TaxID=872970 RepID=A0A1H8IXX5_9BACI|nr:pyocin knob domain-containing protein [Amphibacillus marinus]SEN73301.1 hypothetical protein SAMN04488134_101765 [Amphibacillus marinus]
MADKQWEVGSVIGLDDVLKWDRKVAPEELLQLVEQLQSGQITVAEARKWAESITVTLAGDVRGNVNIDGSGNVTLTVTVNKATQAEAEAGESNTRFMTPLRTAQAIFSAGLAKVADLAGHIANRSNPHQVTNEQVGLGNVDNAKQATKQEFDVHIDNEDNPHDVTTRQVNILPTSNTDVTGQSGISEYPFGITSLQIINRNGFPTAHGVLETVSQVSSSGYGYQIFSSRVTPRGIWFRNAISINSWTDWKEIETTDFSIGVNNLVPSFKSNEWLFSSLASPNIDDYKVTISTEGAGWITGRLFLSLEPNTQYFLGAKRADARVSIRLGHNLNGSTIGDKNEIFITPSDGLVTVRIDNSGATGSFIFENIYVVKGTKDVGWTFPAIDVKNHMADLNNPHKVTSEQINHLPAESISNDTGPDEFPVGISVVRANSDLGFPVQYGVLTTEKSSTRYTTQYYRPVQPANRGQMYFRNCTTNAGVWGDWMQVETTGGAQSKINTHANLKNNPHNVTAAQVGLGNVQNYSFDNILIDPTYDQFRGAASKNLGPASNNEGTVPFYILLARADVASKTAGTIMGSRSNSSSHYDAALFLVSVSCAENGDGAMVISLETRTPVANLVKVTFNSRRYFALKLILPQHRRFDVNMFQGMSTHIDEMRVVDEEDVTNEEAYSGGNARNVSVLGASGITVNDKPLVTPPDVLTVTGTSYTIPTNFGSSVVIRFTGSSNTNVTLASGAANLPAGTQLLLSNSANKTVNLIAQGSNGLQVKEGYIPSCSGVGSCMGLVKLDSTTWAVFGDVDVGGVG